MKNIKHVSVVFALCFVAASFGSAVSADSDVSPLSGLPRGAGKPVVMVKYGKSTPDRPHYNLNQDDLFYVEEVEWGLTRIAAMFNTKFPM